MFTGLSPGTTRPTLTKYIEDWGGKFQHNILSPAIFREALRDKSGKILVARSIRWRQPRPNELAQCVVRC